MTWAKFGEGLREGVCLMYIYIYNIYNIYVYIYIYDFLRCIEMYLCDGRFQRLNAPKH